jgi:hypothetical protein
LVEPVEAKAAHTPSVYGTAKVTSPPTMRPIRRGRGAGAALAGAGWPETGNPGAVSARAVPGEKDSVTSSANATPEAKDRRMTHAPKL